MGGFLSTMFNFFANNWQEILTGAAVVHGAATGIVNLTPTPKPTANKWLQKSYKGIEVAAGLATMFAKQKPEDRDKPSPSRQPSAVQLQPKAEVDKADEFDSPSS